MQISSIGTKIKQNNLTYKRCGYHKPNVTVNPISADSVYKFLSAKSFVSFGKRQANQIPFEKTIDLNFFKLPKIKTKKGNIVQALPDKTQFACAKSLYEGNNTVCIAPTGTGKTAIANYVITKNINEGKKTIYTTPLKALSNDKYREFCNLYGKENAGLLTGDIKLNKEAPIVIMTTEIYRNMALDTYSKGNYGKFSDVKTVIFDEAHYISEKERGKIWEESVMLTPPSVQILPLSATIGNGREFTDWISSVTMLPTKLVEASPKDRHVPLIYYNYTGENKESFQELIKGNVNTCQILENFYYEIMSQRQVRALDMLVQKKNNEDDDYEATYEEREQIVNELTKLTYSQSLPHQRFSKIIQKHYKLKEQEAQEITQLLLDSDSRSIKDFKEPTLRKQNKNNYRDLVQALKYDEKLPALVFIFSRKNCNDAATILADSGLNLTSQKEKQEIEKILEEYKNNGIYLGSEFNKKELLQGIAPHHAGLLPSYKKLVEELFSKKLVKVVFATSTLSAGINMPAKTVVITAIDRPTKDSNNEIKYIPLTSNEFHQMSGRAGRRGIDKIGNVVLYDIGGRDIDIAKNLILKSPDDAKSKFSPSYSFLPAYYEKCEDDNLLDYFERNTLRVFQSENKEAEVNNLKEEYKKYRNVLIEKGFLTKTDKGFRPTQKGKMLIKAHGYNELTLVETIYSGTLKNLSPVELAAFAASMSAVKDNENEMSDYRPFVEYLEQNAIDDNGESPLIEVLDVALDYDQELENLEIKQNIKNKSDNQTGVLEASVAYAWANSNKINKENSISNFQTIRKKIVGNKAKNKKLPNILMKGFEDGALYGKLAKSIDILKQVINICEYVIESGEYENLDYYEDLIEKSQEAIELLKQPPIYDVNSVKANED